LSLNAKLPVELDRIMGRTLEKDRNMRCQSVSDLRSDLQRLKRDIEAAGHVATGSRPTPARAQSAIRRSLGVALVLAIVIALSLLYLAASRKTVRSVAVLPFTNASSDSNAEYLSNGMTESIINTLAQVPKLHVMARNTVFSYKGHEVDPRKVGQD